jgi:hypothetical protein
MPKERAAKVPAETTAFWGYNNLVKNMQQFTKSYDIIMIGQKNIIKGVCL